MSRPEPFPTLFTRPRHHPRGRSESELLPEGGGEVAVTREAALVRKSRHLSRRAFESLERHPKAQVATVAMNRRTGLLAEQSAEMPWRHLKLGGQGREIRRLEEPPGNCRTCLHCQITSGQRPPPPDRMSRRWPLGGADRRGNNGERALLYFKRICAVLNQTEDLALCGIEARGHRPELGLKRPIRILPHGTANLPRHRHGYSRTDAEPVATVTILTQMRPLVWLTSVVDGGHMRIGHEWSRPFMTNPHAGAGKDHEVILGWAAVSEAAIITGAPEDADLQQRG